MIVILSPKAEKSLRRIPKIDQFALAQKIRSLRDNPNSSGEEKLQGIKSVFRVRVGDYRIVYRRFKDKIYIVLIGHRKDIYSNLKHLLR